MRGNEIEALTEGRRRRREKLDLALNSIEGERSQFGLAAEGSWKQFVRSGGQDQLPVPDLCWDGRMWVWVWVSLKLHGQTGGKEAANGCWVGL